MHIDKVKNNSKIIVNLNRCSVLSTLLPKEQVSRVDISLSGNGRRFANYFFNIIKRIPNKLDISFYQERVHYLYTTGRTTYCRSYIRTGICNTNLCSCLTLTSTKIHLTISNRYSHVISITYQSSK